MQFYLPPGPDKPSVSRLIKVRFLRNPGVAAAAARRGGDRAPKSPRFWRESGAAGRRGRARRLFLSTDTPEGFRLRHSLPFSLLFLRRTTAARFSMSSTSRPRSSLRPRPSTSRATYVHFLPPLTLSTSQTTTTTTTVTDIALPFPFAQHRVLSYDYVKASVAAGKLLPSEDYAMRPGPNGALIGRQASPAKDKTPAAAPASPAGGKRRRYTRTEDLTLVTYARRYVCARCFVFSLSLGLTRGCCPAQQCERSEGQPYVGGCRGPRPSAGPHMAEHEEPLSGPLVRGTFPVGLMRQGQVD